MRLADRIRARSGRRLLPLAPAIVVLLGLAAALAIAAFGRADLARASDATSLERAAAMADALAARLAATPSDERGELLQHAARVSGADVLVADAEGVVRAEASVGAPDRAALRALEIAERGLSTTALGRVAFAARRLGATFPNLSVVVLVPAPSPPPRAAQFASAVAALAALVLGAAAAVAYVFAGETRRELAWVARRVAAMGTTASSPSGEPVPLRSLDPLGTLTAAFDLLVARFRAAEQSYRQDLVAAARHDRDRSALLAALSHELRTPLNGVLGLTDVLLAGVDGPLGDDERENLSIVRSSALHLRDLVDDVLDLSAIESGELRLDLAPADVSAIARDVVAEARAALGSKPVELALEGDPVAIATIDAKRVRQVLANLVGNAAKFTERGRVEVRVERTAAGLAVACRDTGPGIAPAALETIFEPYRQAGSARSRRAGVGLGLSIAKRLVEMHGGALEVATEVGRGSTFTVRLREPPTAAGSGS